LAEKATPWRWFPLRTEKNKQTVFSSRPAINVTGFARNFKVVLNIHSTKSEKRDEFLWRELRHLIGILKKNYKNTHTPSAKPCQFQRGNTT